MNRRRTSVLVLVMAALASVATKRALPQARIELDPSLVWYDPADPMPLVLQLEAGFDEDARRAARIEYGSIDLWAEGTDVPDGVIFVASGDTAWVTETPLSASFDAACTEEDCEATVEIAVEAPDGTPAFPLHLHGGATIGLEDFDDEADVRGTLTVSGAPGVSTRTFEVESVRVTVDPAAPPMLLARLEATSDARLYGRSIEVTAVSHSPEPYVVRVRLTDGVTSADESVNQLSASRFPGSCTADPCVATVEITFDVPADNGPFDVTIGASAVAYVDASAGAADVSGGLTLGPAAP
jgi:hypothetical protein